MQYELKMPDLATTGSVVKIVHWLAKPGDTVVRGQPLLEVETDKAAMEVESTASGTLVRIEAKEGAEADTGTVLGVIETGASTPFREAPAPLAVPAGPPHGKSPVPKGEPAAPSPTGGLFARNRRAASAAGGGVGTESLAGTGPLSVARRTAARRLQHSKQTIPHFYLQTSFNASAVMAARAVAGPPKPVWDAFFVQAVSRVLPRFAQLACRFDNEQLVPQGTDTIGVAADIDGDLFIVPVETPRTKDVNEISRGIRERVDAIRSGNPEACSLAPGVFTISNLGACDIEGFAAIINPPESAILAVGKIRPVVFAVSSERFEIQHRANLTLSVDHRVANGKIAADFLGAVVGELEKS